MHQRGDAVFDYQQLQEGFNVMLQNYDATQEANGVSGAYALVEQLLRLYVHAEPAIQRQACTPTELQTHE